MQTTKKSLHPLRTLSGFTLVELIVVITILVILGTIGFVSLQGYSLSARDSVRVENLSNLHKGLTLFNIVSSSYPLPESFVTITASGTDIGYQGFAKDLVGGIAKLSRGATTDPLDPSISTTYSVNASKTKMQLMSFLEDGNSTLAFLPNAYASIGSDYSKRSYLVKGDGLGILLASGSLQPVQESGTGVDIINTTGSFTMYMNKAQQFMGTGVALRAGIAGDGIVGYWNFDELGNLIKDSSGKGNSGVCYYTTGSTTNCGTIGQGPQFINGKIGLAMSGAGLKIAPFGDLKSKNLTISLWLRSTNTGTGYFDVINQWDCSAGTCQVENEAPWWFGIKSSGPHLKNPVFISTGSGWDANISQSNGNYNLPIQGDNLWHFFIIEKIDTTITLYMDGNKFATKKNTTETINSNYPLYIGRSGHSNHVDLSNGVAGPAGLIDEVRIYNRALSDSEIQALYNATK